MQQCRGLCDRCHIKIVKNTRAGTLASQGGCYCKTCENTILLSSLIQDKVGRPICPCCKSRVRKAPRHLPKSDTIARVDMEDEINHADETSTTLTTAIVAVAVQPPIAVRMS